MPSVLPTTASQTVSAGTARTTGSRTTGCSSIMARIRQHRSSRAMRLTDRACQAMTTTKEYQGMKVGGGLDEGFTPNGAGVE